MTDHPNSKSKQTGLSVQATTAPAFCWAPFRQMLLSPTGSIHPCCYHFGLSYGRSDEALDKLWNGPKIRKLRREFLDGQPRSCKARIANLQCHKEFDYLAEDRQASELIAKPPRRLDIRLSGQCNLKCIMCDVWQQPRDRYDESFLWSEGKSELFPYLTEVEIAGGEPFIQKQVFKLVKLIHASNADVQFTFITNGHFLQAQNVFALLDAVHLKRLQISLDALDAATYQSIRRGGDFTLAMENLNRFLAYRNVRSFDLKLSFCVVRQNWQFIPDFLAFCRSHAAICELQYAHYDPAGTASLNSLSRSELQEVAETMLTWYCDPEDQPQVDRLIHSIQLSIKRKAQTSSSE